MKYMRLAAAIIGALAILGMRIDGGGTQALAARPVVGTQTQTQVVTITQKDMLGDMHQGTVSVTYALEGRTAGGALYRVTRVVYRAKGVIWGTIAVLSGDDHILKYDAIGCVWWPGGVWVQNKISLRNGTESWRPNIEVDQRVKFLVRTAWVEELHNPDSGKVEVIPRFGCSYASIRG